jgi:putative tricarboxylic transport membrane protein
LLTYGIQPGPAIVSEHLDLMYLIIWSFAIASVVGAFLCFLATPSLAKLTKVPFAVLGPGLLVIMLLGAYQEGGQLGDLWVMVALGVVGWLLKATNYPRAPFLIGFVLAIPMERYYYLTVNLYDGAAWMTRPGVLIFLAILVVPMLWSGFKWLRTRREAAVDEGHRHQEDPHDADDELEGSLQDSVWSLALAAVVVTVFGIAFVVSGSFSPEAQLMPRLVSVGGLLVGLILLAQEVTVRRNRTGVGPGWTKDVTVASRTFVAMGVFLTLVALGGYLAAMLLFVPVFLLYVARARPRVTVAYTLVLGAALLLLPSLLPVDLPTGILQ